MSRRTITLGDFKAGEFGQLAASAAPPDSFTGTNVMVFQDGSLGPRPGLKSIVPSSRPTGTVWGLIAVGRSITRGVIFGVGSTVYGFTYSPLGAVSSIGSLAGTPSNPVHMIQYGTKAYMTRPGDKGYFINPTGPAVTALTAMPGGQTLAVYGERMVTANTPSNLNRVYYSNAADFSTWPALSFFDVSAIEHSIEFIAEIRSRLAIANIGNEWWSLSGVPGVNSTLRRTPRSDLAPFYCTHAARLGESLWFLPSNEDFPAQFTGTVTDKLRHRYLSFAGGPTTSKVDLGGAALLGTETLVFASKTAAKMLVHHNDVWTVHTIPSGIGPFITPIAEAGIGVTDAVLVLCDAGGGGISPNFYVWKPTLERPGKTGDTEAQPGDGSTTPLAANAYLPEWWTRDGKEVTVRSVTVDFKKWNTGSSSTNHFDITLRALHRTGVSGYKDSKVQSFDEATSLTAADATPDRRVFTFGDQGPAHGFQLRFDNIRGVALRPRITVEVDETPMRAA